MKKIAIVGNGKFTKDQSFFIDNCDFVVRFNECKNFGDMCGHKTDVLCINNTGAPIDRINEKKSILNAPFYQSFSELWFPRNKNIHELNTNGDFTDKSKSLLDVNFLSDRSLVYFSYDLNKFVFWILKKVSGKKLRKMKCPSTGFFGICYVLSSYRFSDYEKYILGFNFRGADSHNWKIEKIVVEILSRRFNRFHIM